VVERTHSKIAFRNACSWMPSAKGRFLSFPPVHRPVLEGSKTRIRRMKQ